MPNLIRSRQRQFQPQNTYNKSPEYLSLFSYPYGYLYTPQFSLTSFAELQGTVTFWHGDRPQPISNIMGKGYYLPYIGEGDDVNCPFSTTNYSDGLTWLMVITPSFSTDSRMQPNIWSNQQDRDTPIHYMGPAFKSTGWYFLWRLQSHNSSYGTATFPFEVQTQGVYIFSGFYSYSKNTTRCWLNGRELTSTAYTRTGSAYLQPKSWEKLFVSNSSMFAQHPACYLLGMSSNTNVSGETLRSLSVNPWQLFTPNQKKYFNPPAAANATRWIGGNAEGTTNWSVAANWSAGVPTKDLDAIIENSTYACNLTMPSVCKSLQIMPNYAAAFATNSQTLSIYGNLHLNGSGTMTVDNTITIGANARIEVSGVSVTNITQASGILTLGGHLTCTGALKILPTFGGFSKGFSSGFNKGTASQIRFIQNKMNLTAAAITVES